MALALVVVCALRCVVGLEGVWLPSALLLTMALLLFGLGVWRFGFEE
jgi:hypothetical protein